MSHYSGRLALQQRVLPSYRIPFFDLLAQSYEGSMSLFAGIPRPAEMIVSGKPQVARLKQADNIHLFGGAFYLCYQRGFINWLEEWNPDSLIVEANPRYLSTPAAVKWMHARGRIVIGWGLGSPKSPSPIGRGAGVRARFINQFDALIAYSQRGADEYAALGFPRDKIFVAQNSVSPAPIFSIPQRPSTFDSRPTILFVGRLQTRKRVDYLLRACSQIESNPRLIIVGDGPERAAFSHLPKMFIHRQSLLGQSMVRS
jgi:glycosyltransferase involved in cell wall biosynthesis